MAVEAAVVVGRAAEVESDTDSAVALAVGAAVEDTAYPAAVVAMGCAAIAAGKDFEEVERQRETAAVEVVYCHALAVVPERLHPRRRVHQGRRTR